MPWRRGKFSRGILRNQRGLLKTTGGLILVFTISCLFLGIYILPRYSDQWDFPPVKVRVSSRRYLTVNEDEELRIAVKNQSDKSILASIRLDGSGDVPVFIEQDGTNLFFSGSIHGSEQIERRVNVFVPYDFGKGKANDTLGKDIILTLWVGLGIQKSEQIAEFHLSTVPIPRPRTLFGLFFSILAGTLTWAFKEWWTIQKEALGRRK